MNTDNFTRFIQLMRMTTSSHDAEALTALRKANAMLDSRNMDWDQLLRSKVKWSGPQEESVARESADRNRRYRGSERASHHASTEFEDGPKFSHKEDDKAAVDLIFEWLDRAVSPSSSFRTFVDDLQNDWEMQGFLTERQFDAIKRAYERSNR